MRADYLKKQDIATNQHLVWRTRIRFQNPTLAIAKAVMQKLILSKKETMEILNSNVTINVRDMDSSISFYKSIGFVLKQRWDNHYAQLTAPGIEIGLHPSDNLNKSNDPKALSIGFTTADFETTKDELTQLEIPFSERNEEGGDFINFKDPDGTPLYFIKPKW